MFYFVLVECFGLLKYITFPFRIIVECSSAEDAKKLLAIESPTIKGTEVQIKAADKTAAKPAASPKKEKSDAGPPPAKKAKGTNCYILYHLHFQLFGL